MSINAGALAAAEANGQRFAEAKGAKSLAELRAMSWQKIVEPVQSANGGGGQGLQFFTDCGGLRLTGFGH